MSTNSNDSVVQQTFSNDIPDYQSMGFGQKAYDDLAAANPALKRQYGDLTLWDQIGNIFGFKTGEDKFKMQQVSDAAEWDSQIASMKFENEYNSTAAQAQRDRAAGINPDLAGNVSSGSAAEMSEAEHQDMSSVVSDPGKALGFVQSALSFGLQFMTGLQNVNGLVLDNEGKSISNILAAAGLGSSHAVEDFGLQDPSAVLLNHGFVDKTEVNNQRNPFKKGSSYFRAYSDAYLGSYNNRSENFKRYFENRLSFVNSLLGSAEGESHPAFGDLTPGSGAEYGNVISAFRDFMKDTFDLSKTKTKNDLTFQEGFDPSQAAAGENAENDLKEQQRNMTNQMNKPLEKLISRLSKAAEDGDVLSSAVLMFLYSFSSGAIQF